ncbi:MULTISPECIES: MFS transporter [unclassified Saccharopolyspora]|uniref:MFS transporter n=1 Tax=unclassified Saccharopolyspora TaxID=2646250 RepID=UPI001CD73055|nr:MULTISPECIES: MFS transporter [unclassified Saccharopolyspora]MCA1185119.1 MFS transporter [Saccharopolyspora sp. 6T]MCA1224994.1 MFS transporter [Saccharopolyspora sp. 6M]MCA1278515.1 MFS transporter [Saccharopolyspora sp. 7B]
MTAQRGANHWEMPMSIGTPGAPAPTAEPERATKQQIRRAVYAGGVGNFVEQFDYGLYGYMAPMLASSFFPGGGGAGAVLSTYAVLAVACVFRPLGGTLVGRWGDRVGRKKALLWTIIMMGVSTALIGALPTYQQVGFLAPLLLVVIRTFQGMISGGEYVGAVAFIVEWAKPNQRAYYTSYASNSCFLGILCGAGVAALVSTLFEQPQLESWGWRLPFLAVLPLSLVGLWLRSRIEETPEFMRETNGGTDIVRSPVREALREQWQAILVFCGASIMLAILSYTWVTYYPEYLVSELGLSRSQALLSNLISVAVLMPLLPLAGKLSDRIGRKPMLISGAVCCIALVPLAFAIGELGGFGAAVGSQLVYIIPEFFLTGIVTTCSAELFATRTRFSASAIAYNSSFSVFMGVTPFVAALLVNRFGTIYAVWAYLAVAAVLALVVITVFMKETYRSELSANKFA